MNYLLLFRMALTGFLLCGSTLVIAQNFNDPAWVKIMATSSGPLTHFQDAQENIYAMGPYEDVVDFDPGAGTYNLTASSGNRDYYVAKYDSQGNFLWVRSFGKNSYYGGDGNFTIDAAGNAYICVNFEGTIDINPTAGTTNVTSAGGQDMYVVKLDPNGNYLWGFRIGAAGHDSESEIAVDAAGNVLITTTVQAAAIDLDPSGAVTNASGSGAALAKYSSSGAYIWGKRIGIYETAEMTTNAAGDVFMIGSFSATVDADPSAAVANLVAAGSLDCFIAKYTASGDYVWAKQLGGAQAEAAASITLDPSGNILVSGTFEGTADFDPSPAVASATSVMYDDIFFAKYDPAGNYIWSRTLGSAGIYDFAGTVRTNAAGDVYVTGTFGDGAMDFDPGPGVSNYTALQRDCFWAKYDAGGNLIWVNTLEGDGYTMASSITVSSTGSYAIIGGGVIGDSDMDPGQGTLPSGNGSNSHAFFGKYTESCTPTASSLSASACSSYTLNAQTYNTSGTYTQTIPNAAGCDSTITLTLTIGDAVNPVPVLASLPNITSECSVTSFTAPTATDNCAGTITATHNATLPITTPGTTIVTWTYNDGNGNTITQTQNVIIDDNTAPVPALANLSDVTGQCSVTSLTAPTATDNCAGTITGTHNATLPITTPGTTIVTWTYNDGNGNAITQTQNVIIDDNTAPVPALANLSDVTGQCSVTSLTAPTATDNCAGTITATHNTTLPITTQGTTVVAWTYNDGNGNTITQTQNVIIDDNTAPVPALANLADVTAQCSVTSLTAPTATDNCAGTITATHNATLPITTQGMTVVTWTYNDGNGNTVTQTQNVTITMPDATTSVSGITITATNTGATYQWINCSGNTPVAGATSQSFTPTANGSYAVTVTENGCSATSACVAITSVGMEEAAIGLFTIYPNPNAGLFNIVHAAPLTIRIMNTAGQLISVRQLEAGENAVALTDVESGIYFITAIGENGQIAVERLSIVP